MNKYVLFLISLFSIAVQAEKIEVDFLKSFGQFKDMESDLLKKASDSALWNQNKTMLAFCFDTQPSQCFILKGDSITDVSSVEAGNFGKLGVPSKSNYDCYKTHPSKWISRSDGLYQIEFITYAWKDGQRYTAKEPLVLDKKGLPLYR